MHWGAPFHWWLAGLAWLDHLATGRLIGQSVERAALYSGPVMLVLLLGGVGILLVRRFSLLAALLGGLSIGLVAKAAVLENQKIVGR